MEFLSLTYIIKEYRDREYVIKVVLCSNFIIYSIFRFIVYFQSTNTTGAHKYVVKSRVSCGRHTTGQTRSESPTSRKKKKKNVYFCTPVIIIIVEVYVYFLYLVFLQILE